MKKLLLSLALCLPAFGAYDHVRPFVVPGGKVSANLTAFPVLVYGTYPYLATIANGGGVRSAFGYDIVFSSNSGCTSLLPFERVGWSSNGAVEFHVSMSLSATADNTVYLCYGNAAVNTDQQSRPWDANFLGVWHLPNGNTLSAVDSTANGNNGTTTSAVAGRGKINGGAAISGVGGIDIGNTASMGSPTTAVTVSAWVNNADIYPGGVSVIAAKSYSKPNSSPWWSYYLANNDPSCPANTFAGAWSVGTTLRVVCAAGPWYPGNWYHVTFTFDGTNGNIYVNGSPSGQATLAGSIAYNNGTFDIGQNSDANSVIKGVIDEVRVSNIARSAAWIKAEANNQADPNSFYRIGSPVSNSAAFTGVSVLGTTNTQAVIRFAHAAASTCFVSASQNSSLYPLADDVNPALFTAANLVSRDSANIFAGDNAQIVLGKRYKAFTALDGNRHSRALEESATYYYDLNCNGDEFEGSFSTRPIAMGNTHLDGIPTDGGGDAAWPNPTHIQRCNALDSGCSLPLSSDRRDAVFIDPQTGLALRPLVLPSDKTIAESNTPAHTFTGTGWTMSGTWNTDGTNATSGSGNTSPLVVGWWTNLFDCAGTCPFWTGSNDAFFGGDVFSTPVYQVPVMLQYSVKANFGNAACTGSNNSPDCRMDVCVTLNWQTCAPNAQIYQQPLSTTATQYTFGSGQAYDVMQQPGKRIWAQFETGWRPGNVTCDGSTTITKIWDSGAMAPDQAPAGSYINIGAPGVGTQQIVSNIDALHYTIAVSCPAGTWSTIGSAFGIMAWKETNSGDSLTLSNQFINTLSGGDLDPQYYSGFAGSFASVSLGNGDPGGLVQMGQGQYSIDLKTGKVGAFAPSSPVSGVAAAHFTSSFDTKGNFWVKTGTNGLAKYVYHGDYATAVNKTSSPHPELPLWQRDMGSILPTCGGAITTNCFDPPVAVTAPGLDLPVLLAAFDSRYNPSIFGQWDFSFVELGKLEFDIQWNGAASQTFWAWDMIFDPDATSNINGPFGAGCVGQNTNPQGGNYLMPGCIVAARPTWETPGARWMTEKGMGFLLKSGWSSTQDSIYFGSGPGEGPAVAHKISSATTASCPANSFSLTTCITFTVDGDPQDFQSMLRSINTQGALGTYMVGDEAILGSDNITYPGTGGTPGPGSPVITGNNVNLLELVAINGTTLTWGCVYGPSQCMPTDVNPQLLWLYSNWPGFNYPWAGGGVADWIMWNYVKDPHGLNSDGMSLTWDISTYNAHAFSANSLFSVGGTNSPRCTANQGCYNNQNFQGLSDNDFATTIKLPTRDNVTGLTAMSSRFANRQGFNGACGNDNCQTHPDFSRLSSDPISAYGIDGRPFIGIGCIPCSSDITQVSGTLYKVANVTYTHPKTFDTMATSSRHILKNKSGVGSSITASGGDNYTFCYALHAGECQNGSSAGDFFVNIPWLDKSIPGATANSACYDPSSGFANGQSANWAINDLCIYDAGMESQSYTRYALNTFDMIGNSEQTFGHLFLGGRADIFSAIHSAVNITTSDYATFYWFPAQFWDGTFETMLIKAPPILIDTAVRTTYQPVIVNVSLIPGSDHVGVEFGYTEYGADGVGGWECSPNRANDPCVATSSTINEATPFYWESESPTLPTSGPIAIPALPEHILYYRPVYFSGSTVVGRGPMQVATIR